MSRDDAVVDGQALVLMQDGLSHFLPNAAQATFEPTQGGLNNQVVYVCMDSKRQHVLRIYNNGLDYGRVQWEHDVLR